MEAVVIGSRLARDHIANKNISFGANNVNVFQNIKIGVTKQIDDQYALHSIKVHYMSPIHQTFHLSSIQIGPTPLEWIIGDFRWKC